MAAESAAPLSRLVDVDRLSPEGADVVVETTPEERAALVEAVLERLG